MIDAACIIFFAYLVPAAILDAKTMEVPLTLQGAAFAFLLAWDIAVRGDVLSYIIPAALLFGILFAGCIFAGLGGADAIAGGLIGMCLGLYGVYAVLFAFLLCLPVQAYRKVKGKQRAYPFMPYVAAGYALCLAVVAARLNI